MKRILLVTSLIVSSLLFAVERSVIYLAFVAATVLLCMLFCMLFAVAHRKPAREISAQWLTMTGEQCGN